MNIATVQKWYNLAGCNPTARQKGKTIPITIRLTPEQIRDVYQQLLEAEQREQDWLYEPEVKAEIANRQRLLCQFRSYRGRDEVPIL